jgi:hypothetical protein
MCKREMKRIVIMVKNLQQMLWSYAVIFRVFRVRLRMKRIVIMVKNLQQMLWSHAAVFRVSEGENDQTILNHIHGIKTFIKNTLIA